MPDNQTSDATLHMLVVEAWRGIVPDSVGERSQLRALNLALQLYTRQHGFRSAGRFVWRAVSEFLAGRNGHTLRSFQGLEAVCHAAGVPYIKYHALAVKRCMDIGLSLAELGDLGIYEGVLSGHNFASINISVVALEHAVFRLENWVICNEGTRVTEVYDPARRILSNAAVESRARMNVAAQRGNAVEKREAVTA